ncbi:MAG: Peptidase family M50 [Methanomassiliicoccales archaeon PtaU1.Bin124]|nr:MAG: Peptidase family M50 [Methanomassiliicoccales archaeon PtaU1.Bin124]
MMPADMLSEVEQVKSIVARYFPIYDVKVNYQAVTLYVTPISTEIEDKFDKMRIEMKGLKYIPFLAHKGGEYTITVIRAQERATRGLGFNVVLLIITAFTMVIAGAVLWGSYSGDTDLFSLNNLLWGSVYFAIPLMTILGVHELSHFLMSKRHNVAASLPFFIPSIPPLGTMGAFISLRDPIPNRKALVDIGIAGPIGGLLVTIPIAILGFWLTSSGTPVGAVPQEGLIGMGAPLLYDLIQLFVPMSQNVYVHPLAFAAWVGFLVTAINLLPAGQLDGGHVARGLLGENARFLSYAVMGILMFLGIFLYTGWLLFGLIVILLGMNHPQPLDDVSKLDIKRKALGVGAIVLLLLTFSPVPLYTTEADFHYEVDVVGGNVVNITAGSTAMIYMEIKNVGNTNYTMTMVVMNVPSEWGRGLNLENQTGVTTERVTFDLHYQETRTVVLELIVPATAVHGQYNIMVDAVSKNSNGDAKITIQTPLTINVS